MVCFDEAVVHVISDGSGCCVPDSDGWSKSTMVWSLNQPWEASCQSVRQSMHTYMLPVVMHNTLHALTSETRAVVHLAASLID